MDDIQREIASRYDVAPWRETMDESQFNELVQILDNGVFCCLDDALGAMRSGETCGTWTFGVLIVAAHIEFKRITTAPGRLVFEAIVRAMSIDDDSAYLEIDNVKDGVQVVAYTSQNIGKATVESMDGLAEAITAASEASQEPKG